MGSSRRGGAQRCCLMLWVRACCRFCLEWRLADVQLPGRRLEQHSYSSSVSIGAPLSQPRALPVFASVPFSEAQPSVGVSCRESGGKINAAKHPNNLIAFFRLCFVSCTLSEDQ